MYFLNPFVKKLGHFPGTAPASDRPQETGKRGRLVPVHWAIQKSDRPFTTNSKKGLEAKPPQHQRQPIPSI